MKNACIVLKNLRGGVSESDFRAIDVFPACGYVFDEIRVLSSENVESFLSEASELWKESENLVAAVGKEELYELGTRLSEALGAPFTQRTLTGAGVLNAGNSTLFLLSSDEGESGAEYAKTVCVPTLNKKYSTRYDKIVLRAVGAGKRLVLRLIDDARRMSGEKLTYTYKGKYGEDIVEIVYDASVPKMLTDDVLRLFAEGLGDAVYALDDTPLEIRLVQLLKLRGKKLSVAESFTGGGIGRRVVSVPGASEVYFEGLNTYDERSKEKRLGVSEYTLKTLGAVSDETAYEMAAGLIASGDCDISVATTGLAGPKSDRSELPIGLCYIAVGLKEQVFVYRYRFEGTREEITETAINYALYLAYKQLKNA